MEMKLIVGLNNLKRNKMKNIHIISTDKPSRLFYNVGGALLFTNHEHYNGVNIYITSDKEIKEGDWCILTDTESVLYEHFEKHRGAHQRNDQWKKIILTTDQDLIRDGVQAIDGEFLEWFVKNPSCERVDVNHRGICCCNTFISQCIDCKKYKPNYKIIIPKEEPKQETSEEYSAQDFLNKLEWNKSKQETIEEAAKEFANNSATTNYEEGINVGKYQGFIKGAKWQQQQQKQMYSEEDVLDAWELGAREGLPLTREKKEKLFNQFKKK